MTLLPTSPPVNRPAQQRNTANHWAATLIAAGITLLLIAGVLIAWQDALNNPVQPPQRGKSLDALVLTDLQGRAVPLHQYTGKPALLNIWASWCPPCRQEMPDLQAYAQKHADQNLVLLAINAGESSQTAAAYMQQNGLTFPTFIDPQEKLMDALAIHDYPTSILVGRDGLVKVIHVGLFTPQALEAELTPFLKP